MSKQDLPLSPHLQIYKPQITSVLSIMHRITGFSLAFIVILFILGLLTSLSFLNIQSILGIKSMIPKSKYQYQMMLNTIEYSKYYNKWETIIGVGSFIVLYAVSV